MNIVAELPIDYVPRAKLLANRIILITGANGGLGRSTALACAGLGATLVLLGRNVKGLEAVYDQIEAMGGNQPAIFPMDLSGATWEDYGTLAIKLNDAFGRIDGIVHAAGHFRAFMPLSQLPPKEWIESLQVNLTAPFAITAQCMPLLDRSEDASVVFVSDPSARAPQAYAGAYGVAKYAQNGLMQIWSEELMGIKPHLRFNSYNPGPMRTRLRRRGYPYEEPGTLAAPDQAVPPILWMIGPDSRGITGQAFSRKPGA